MLLNTLGGMEEVEDEAVDVDDLLAEDDQAAYFKFFNELGVIPSSYKWCSATNYWH